MTDKLRTLGAISEDLLAIEELMLEAGGDVSDPEIEKIIDQWLGSLGAERDRKLDGYCRLIEENEAAAKARKEAAKRLTTLASSNASLATRLRARLFFFLQLHGVRRIDTNEYQITVVNNGGPLPVLVKDEHALPEEYKVTTIIQEADRDRIRRALEAGEEVEGAELGERGQHLRIK